MIAIEATQEKSSPPALVSIEPESMTFATELDSFVDRIAQSDPVVPRELAHSFNRPDRSDTPNLQPTVRLPDLPTDHEVMLERRKPDELMPQVTLRESLPRPKAPRPAAEPPTPATTPIQQFVGLEKEAPVDLSSNEPPEYPLEAVRRRLEGVVMLSLTINASGSAIIMSPREA